MRDDSTLTPGVHAFDQGVDDFGNYTFAIVDVADDKTFNTHELAGHAGMTQDDAVAAFIEARDGPTPEKRADIEAEAVARAKTRDLSRPEFFELLALTDLEDVWLAIEAALKDLDRATYAKIRSQREQQVFRLDVTLAHVAQMRPIAAQIAPDVDMSDDTIRAAWAQVAGGVSLSA